MSLELNGWPEWGRYVLKELERLNSCQERIERDVAAIKGEIAAQKVRSSLWGGAAGLVPAVIALIYYLTSR